MKILLSIIFALIVFFITALIIGPENKALWFKKRTKYSFFNRRGIISEHLFYGYPRTKEGILVTFIMICIIAIGCFLISLL